MQSTNRNRRPPDVAAPGTHPSLARGDKSMPSKRAGVRKLSRSEKSVHEARCAKLYLLLLPVRVWPVRAKTNRYMDMCLWGLSLEDAAAETSRITGKNLMRVRRWFYRKTSQTRRSGGAPPKHNKPASDKMPCTTQSFEELWDGCGMAAGSCWDSLMLNSGDHGEEKLSDLTRSRQVTPPGVLLDPLIASGRRAEALDATWFYRLGQGHSNFPSPWSCSLGINSAELGEPARLQIRTAMQATTARLSDSSLLLDLNAHPAPQ